MSTLAKCVSFIFQPLAILFSVYSVVMIPKFIKNKKLAAFAIVFEIINITYQVLGIISTASGGEMIFIIKNYMSHGMCLGIAILNVQILSLFSVLLPSLTARRINLFRVAWVIFYLLTLFQNIALDPQFVTVINY